MLRVATLACESVGEGWGTVAATSPRGRLRSASSTPHLLYQHDGGGIVMVRAPYMGLRNCVKAGVHLHPAVSVISSSLTMSGTVATAVLGVSDLVRLRASQLRRCRAGGYWDLPLLCQCPCAVVAWRPQHESPLLLSPRRERNLFADLPILGGQCCDLE